MIRLLTTTTAAAIALGMALGIAAWPAHADNAIGQWMDTRNHLALGNLPDNSEPIARLQYAGGNCAKATGITPGVQTPAYLACMKGEGFVYVYFSAEEMAARDAAQQEAIRRAKMAAWGAAVGQAASDMARTMNPPVITCQRYGSMTQCH